jgi:hypothetical protein
MFKAYSYRTGTPSIVQAHDSKLYQLIHIFWRRYRLSFQSQLLTCIFIYMHIHVYTIYNIYNTAAMNLESWVKVVLLVRHLMPVPHFSQHALFDLEKQHNNR